MLPGLNRVLFCEMRVLEGFCRLVVGLDVEDRVSLETVPFAYKYDTLFA